MKKIYFKKNGVIKESKEGFAWDVLLLGPIVPLSRGDLKNTIIMILMFLFLFWVGNIAFAFEYNKMYNDELFANGWKRCDKNGKLLKITKGKK